MAPSTEIQIIAVLIGAACALPGSFLVLRRMSMMSDAITHTILLGIVLAFFVTGDLSSPLLIAGATVIGVLTVWLTELLRRSRLVAEDAAIGTVFPLLFSIAIILISRYAGSAHLDTDSVLLGELAFAPFHRLIIFGMDIGARGIYVGAALLLLNVVVIALFFKELKASTFDPVLAAILGISPTIVYYGLMTLVSVTAVGAFESVGSVLVVAFMIAPPATAYLLTDDLKKLLWLSAGIGAATGLVGYRLASLWDVSIAGMMALVAGAVFFLAFAFAPRRGLISSSLMRRRRRRDFADYTLILHLYTHGDGIFSGAELAQQLRWDLSQIDRVCRSLIKAGSLTTLNGRYALTDAGTLRCHELIETLFASPRHQPAAPTGSPFHS